MLLGIGCGDTDMEEEAVKDELSSQVSRQPLLLMLLPLLHPQPFYTLRVPFCCPEHLEQQSTRKVKKPLFVSWPETLLQNPPGALRNNLFPSFSPSKKSDSFRLVMLGVCVLNKCCQVIVIYIVQKPH